MREILGTGRALVEMECDGRALMSTWTAPDRTQELIKLPVTEEMRGGVTLRITYVRENRAYVHQSIVEVPWTNKRLAVKWESFRSKLMPGQKETWTAVVTGPDAKRTAAEMVATLYDASLDQYVRHNWPQMFNVFRSESEWVQTEFQNADRDFQRIRDWHTPKLRPANWTYRSFPSEAMTGADEEAIVLSPFSVDAAGAGGSYRALSTLAGSRVELNASRAPSTPSRPARPSWTNRSLGLHRHNMPAVRTTPVRIWASRGPQEPQRNGLLLPASASPTPTAWCSSNSPCPRR